MGGWLFVCDGGVVLSVFGVVVTRKLLLPFPSSYLVECGFSAVNYLLLKKRNRSDITK